MTDWFVRSGAGGTASGADWTNAKLTLAAAFTAGAAGDRFWVADDHAETDGTASLTLTGPGTAANPCAVYCADHTVASPGTGDLKITATITRTGAFRIDIVGYAYYYGITFNSGTSTNGPTPLIGFTTTSGLSFEACQFALLGTGASTYFVGATSTNRVRIDFNNCTFKFSATGQFILACGGYITYRNCTSFIQGSVPTTLLQNANQVSGTHIFTGVDLSAAGSGNTLVGSGNLDNIFYFEGCKLGASVTIFATPAAPGPLVSFVRCDSGATSYFQALGTYFGTLTQETTIVRSGGASDGTTPLSWKLVSTANAKWLFPFESFPIAIWNDTTGSSRTATVEIVASAGLNNDDVWLEVEYLGDASSPQASFATSTKANNLATGTALTASAATWASSPGSPQKLSVTFTPQQAGDIRCCVKVGKASQTVYVDPKVTLSPAPKIARHDRIVAPGVYVNAPVGASRLVGGALAA